MATAAATLESPALHTALRALYWRHNDGPDDPPTAAPQLQRAARDLPRLLAVHTDIETRLAMLTSLPGIEKRVSLVLHHLAAEGRTSVVKACAGNGNEGWRRTPLGGHGGNHYYLWWAPAGAPPVKHLDLPRDAVVVRALRHHDDHDPLRLDSLDAVLPITSANDLSHAPLYRAPWSEAQVAFIQSQSSVRALNGQPGSGKTTALWHAVDARSAGRTLYLTFSRPLADAARHHFAAFAPSDAEVQVLDFDTFLGAVLGRDLKRLPAEAQRAALQAAWSHCTPSQLGPWAGRLDAAWVELRAHLLGAALIEDHWEVLDDLHPKPAAGRPLNFDPKSAVWARWRENRSDALDEPAQSALKGLVARLRQTVSLGALFPELEAAAEAVLALGQDQLPAAFVGLDRVVIDEVQDLTLLEVAAVVALVHAVAREQDHLPALVVCGDEGQTVQATGFSFARLHDLLSGSLADPQPFDLWSNLRAPRELAAVAARAAALYRELDKADRPAGQVPTEAEHRAEARRMHVEVVDRAEALALLEALADREDVVVVSAAAAVPTWVPEDRRDLVLTPAQAKGLEFQTVCVLDVGEALVALDLLGDDPVDRLERRQRIDALRVAISRATETLIFLDTGPIDPSRRDSDALLGQGLPVDADDLLDAHLNPEPTPVVARVTAQLQDARRLLGPAPRRAWRKIKQATGLLRAPGHPEAVTDESLRAEVYTEQFRIAARLLIDEQFQAVSAADLLDGAATVTEACDWGDDFHALVGLHKWHTEDAYCPVHVVNDLAEAPGAWPAEVLPAVAQKLRRAVEGAARVAGCADQLFGPLEAGLARFVDRAEVASLARRLRVEGTDALLAGQYFVEAEPVARAISGPEDPERVGQCLRGQQRFAEAAEAFERAGDRAIARACWREAGDAQSALALAEPDTAEAHDLQWLAELRRHVLSCPAGLDERLTDAERARLEAVLLTVRPRPRPATPAPARAVFPNTCCAVNHPLPEPPAPPGQGPEGAAEHPGAQGAHGPAPTPPRKPGASKPSSNKPAPRKSPAGKKGRRR